MVIRSAAGFLMTVAALSVGVGAGPLNQTSLPLDVGRNEADRWQGSRNELSTVGRTWVAYTKNLNGREQAVWIAAPDGGEARRLAAGRSPVVSPDGRWVAFKRCPKSPIECPDLYMISTLGGKARLLARRAGSVVWSPNSDRVVTTQRRSLIVVDIVSAKRVVLDQGPVFFGFSFSPSGRRVAYAKAEREDLMVGGSDMFVVSSWGGVPVALSRDGRSTYPVWGPRYIAFARTKPTGGRVVFRVWRMNADGSHRLALTTGPVSTSFAGFAPVAWSWDGRRLLARRVAEFDGRPYAVNPVTGAIRQIGRFGNDLVFTAGLSRDGRFVLLQRGEFNVEATQRIEVIPFTGGSARVLTENAGEPSWNK